MKLIESIEDSLAEMSLEEIDDFAKDLKSYVGERKATNEALRAKKAKAELKEGVEVLVVYKDSEVYGRVTRIGDKSFTVEIENENGELKKVPRAYRFYIGLAKEEDVA